MRDGREGEDEKKGRRALWKRWMNKRALPAAGMKAVQRGQAFREG